MSYTNPTGDWNYY